MNIYVAILLGLVFTVVYSAVNTFLYNMNYKKNEQWKKYGIY